MRFLLVVLFLCSNCSAYDISAGLKKLADSIPYEVSSIELYLSPITPGGQWGFTPNVKNLYLIAVGKLECKWTECKVVVSKPLIDRYVEEILLPTDDELVGLSEDPTPDVEYKEKLKELKNVRRNILRLEMIQKYHVIPEDSK